VNFDVAVNGRPWKIAIEPADEPGHFSVTVKGQKRVMNALWIDPDTLSMIEGSAVHEARIDRVNAETLRLLIDGRGFDAVVSPGRDSRLVAPGGANAEAVPGAAATLDGSRVVKAPMPGRIVRVLVAVGERVTARQGLLVVEAMKMENELVSPKDGIVKELNVQEGAAVDAGAVLIVIE
jgi:biotin carboxyl carrier protein